MKIAVVTLTRDDGLIRLKQWKEFYEEYRKDVFLHVVVDNASQNEYHEMLKTTFPDSVIIRRETNGGCTGAYNDGIRYCLENSDVDAIAVLANDIRLSKDALKKMYNILVSDDLMCMIAPAMCVKDTDVIEDFGHTLGADLSMVTLRTGEDIKALNGKTEYTELVNGGTTLTKSFFYREYGLQDDNLFMYSDEVDTALRVKRSGYKIGVTAQAVAWHYHISLPNGKTRASYCNYLMCRNKVYIAKKYLTVEHVKTVYKSFMRRNCRMILVSIAKMNPSMIQYAIYGIKGLRHGVRGDMKPNKFSQPN